MSDQQPPFGPPPGPPPAQPPYQPPYQPPAQAPYLPPAQPPNQPPPVDYAGYGYNGAGGPKPRNTKKWLIGGGSVVAAAALIGGGAFAAASLLGGSDDGPTPADALPDSTFAYASFDLSHLGDALTMLAKFPGITQNSTLSSVTGGSGDPREKLVKAILGDSDNSCGLTWEKDFAPWLGQKAAVAGVDVKDSPTPVVVVEVKDADAAKTAFDKFNSCGSGNDAAYSIAGDWALLGEKQDAVNEIAKEATSGSLADDSDYKKWTGEVGDPGLVTLYASPKAGQELSTAIKQHPDALGNLADDGSSITGGSNPFGDDSDGSGLGFGFGNSITESGGLLGFCPGLFSSPGGAASSYEKAFANFGGAAATLRFSNGGAELETAADFGKTSSASSEAGSLVQSLPDDTAVAVGASVGDHAFESALDGLGSICGSGFDASSLETQLSQMTGLNFPTDIDTLLGKGVALSVGKDFDPSNASDPSDLPVALKIKGDPDAIEQVIGKISGRLGSASSVLGTDKDSDNVAIGPNEAYRKSVLADGGLGSDATFKNVVPNADKASAILYVNFNDFDKLVGSGEAAQNYKVLDGLGISAWYDGTTQHSLTRLSTD